MKQEYHQYVESFKSWADLQHWCQLETLPYENGDYKLYYVTPTGQDVDVYVNKSGMVLSVTTNTHTYVS